MKTGALLCPGLASLLRKRCRSRRPLASSYALLMLTSPSRTA